MHFIIVSLLALALNPFICFCAQLTISLSISHTSPSLSLSLILSLGLSSFSCCSLWAKMCWVCGADGLSRVRGNTVSLLILSPRNYLFLSLWLCLFFPMLLSCLFFTSLVVSFYNLNVYLILSYVAHATCRAVVYYCRIHAEYTTE